MHVIKVGLNMCTYAHVYVDFRMYSYAYISTSIDIMLLRVCRRFSVYFIGILVFLERRTDKIA
jgi:hypothetical protein